jgi:hypothetical protein
MTTISSRVFLENPTHYLKLAVRESVAIKRGKVILQITPQPQFENYSPSGDPYWADPRNVAELKHRIQERREGKNPIVATIQGSEAIENYINSL